ncbi:centrosomal protein kizuna isoform X1 [Xiphophorus hellerii]|uniref:centrosomal protein kizuna isoform X1 n=1 Tax=Xiphophorus hellerii TaxID=8084 RepID=UPI0013B3B8A1|nr:centrosomal protein kizuna isoform X1 [Xiphophorus hellerii]
MAGSTYSEDRYYAKIASIQQNMRKSEKRRLELEREMFAYSRSDSRILQIKCSKLRSYLKEICGREAQAKMRNLQLKRDVECMEISMEYSSDHGTLQQQKADFLEKIFRFTEASSKTEELEGAKSKAVQRRQWDNSKNFKQVEIFMDRQTSRGYDAEAGTTSVHSHQALQRSPNRSVQPCERLPSGLLKDFRVGGEDAASKRAHLSDDISSSNDSPDGCNLSDKHERVSGLLPSARASTAAAGCVASASDDEREASPLVTLTRSEKNPFPSNGNPAMAKNPATEPTDSQEVARKPLIMGDEERGLSHLKSETTFRKGAQETSGKCESVGESCSDVQLSESSSSDLTISLTQSELEEDLPAEAASERNASCRGSGDHKQHRTDSSPHSDESKNTERLNSESSTPGVTLKSLSLEGLFNLLDSIEGRLHGKQSHVYRDSSIDGRQLNRIISLCDDGAGLIDEDLEACGTVVLHELRRLSWSTEKGCVLSQELVRAHQSNTEPNEISTSLPPNAARLWDRWFKHALVLKESRVLSTERLVQLFTPLLLERDADYSQQAKVFLRALLSRSSEEGPSAEDESDSSSLCNNSSALAVADVEPSRSVCPQNIQELQSTEEDSQDKSLVESGPIRETKAYKLLKQSAMQKRLPSSEEEEEESSFSGINHGHEEDLGRAKRSSHQDPYPRKGVGSKVYSALQTKDFWQESDDSDFEIEAALRPPTFSGNSDGTDDFYH